MHEKLKKYFEEKGISQKQIAEKLGVSVPSVNAVLNGTKPLGKKNADKWANLFGLSKTFLLAGEGEPCQTNEKENNSPFDTPVHIPSSIDISFYVEKAVEKATAYADKMIATLERRVEDKNKIIKLLEQRVNDLEALQRLNGEQNPLSKYPFEIGVAEPSNNIEQAQV